MNDVTGFDGPGLTPQWERHARAVGALFSRDPDVRCELEPDPDDPTLTLRVRGAEKADAISRLLPASVPFGDVTLAIAVERAADEPTPAEVFERAFRGNPAFAGTLAAETPIGTLDYALFAPEAVQWHGDDVSSPWGTRTSTLESLAWEVLDVPPGIFVTSALVDGITC